MLKTIGAPEINLSKISVLCICSPVSKLALIGHIRQSTLLKSNSSCYFCQACLETTNYCTSYSSVAFVGWRQRPQTRRHCVGQCENRQIVSDAFHVLDIPKNFVSPFHCSLHGGSTVALYLVKNGKRLQILSPGYYRWSLE